MKYKKIYIVLIVLLCNLSIAQTDLIFKNGLEFIPRLNDTGVTWAGEFPSGNNTDCTSTTITSPQDCNQGRDATHNDDSDGHAGFSFTKLDLNGIPLVDQSVDYATTPWACVRDNVTGLVWEVKTISINPLIHGASNYYDWGGVTHEGSGFGVYYNGWDVMIIGYAGINGSNADAFCGFNSGWRVPSLQELMSIVDNSRSFPDPTIDTNYFPNTQFGYYWSATPVTFSPVKAWTVDFRKGGSVWRDRVTTAYVRLVH